MKPVFSCESFKIRKKRHRPDPRADDLVGAWQLTLSFDCEQAGDKALDQRFVWSDRGRWCGRRPRAIAWTPLRPYVHCRVIFFRSPCSLLRARDCQTWKLCKWRWEGGACGSPIYQQERLNNWDCTNHRFRSCTCIVLGDRVPLSFSWSNHMQSWMRIPQNPQSHPELIMRKETKSHYTNYSPPRRGGLLLGGVNNNNGAAVLVCKIGQRLRKACAGVDGVAVFVCTSKVVVVVVVAVAVVVMVVVVVLVDIVVLVVLVVLVLVVLVVVAVAALHTSLLFAKTNTFLPRVLLLPCCKSVSEKTVKRMVGHWDEGFG